MSDLADFLLARIAEDEAAARAAIEPDHLYPYADRSLPRRRPEDMPEDVIGYLGGSWGEHFARWASLRVLAECEAKRWIIEKALAAWDASECTECNAAGYLADAMLADLALPYAVHPDYPL